MLFNSYEFLFHFLPIVFVGFFVIAKINRNFSALWLAGASIYFYGFWSDRYIPLLLSSITANYLFGYIQSKTSKPARKRKLLFLSIAFNIGLLAYYKYTNFFADSLSTLTGVEIFIAEIALPLGISFFTFTQIAFLVDTYRGIAKEYNFVHYTLFVTYFPHLIAGPILHHAQMMPQFKDEKTYEISIEKIGIGVIFFSIGLAKKVLLADNFAIIATPIFSITESGGIVSFQQAWIGAIGYTLQLYFDFSGYCDMAIGISLFFGVNLPFNFNSPYKSSSIIEFWRRWHITLSKFLRDYLYIPLGGNRKGSVRRQINLITTMLLGGLWHGASWTFVIWGALHGMFLMINHLWNQVTNTQVQQPSKPLAALRKISGVAITFICVVFAWVLFRAESFSSAHLMISAMVSAPKSEALHTESMTLIAVGLLLVFFFPNTQQLADKVQNAPRILVYVLPIVMAAVVSLALLNVHKPSEFIYFNF